MRSVLIALIFVLAGLTVWQARERFQVRQVSSSAPRVAEEPAPPPLEDPHARVPDALAELLKGNALQVLPYHCRPGDCRLLLHVETRATCDLGDVDIIEQYVTKTKRRRLIFSVEPLTAEKATPAESVAVEIKDLRGGFSHEFNLDGIREFSRLGIFLCFDDRNSGHCATKAAADMVNFSSVRAGLHEAEVEGPIVYFEPLILAASDQLVTTGFEHGKMEKTYAVLFRWLARHTPAEPWPSFVEEQKTAYKIARRTGSVPLENTKLGLALPLPRHDPSCPPSGRGLAPLKESAQVRQLKKRFGGKLPPLETK